MLLLCPVVAKFGYLTLLFLMLATTSPTKIFHIFGGVYQHQFVQGKYWAIARNYNYSPLIEGNPVVTAVELDIANINTNTVDTDGEPLYKKFIGINKIVVATYRYCYQ